LTTRAQKSILFIYPERNQCYSAKNDWKEGTHTCGDEDLQNMQTADAREFLWLGSSCFLLISLTPSKYSSLTAPSSVFEDNNFDGGVCLPQLVANCRPRPDSFSHLVFYGTSSFSYRPAEITSAAGTNPASRRNQDRFLMARPARLRSHRFPANTNRITVRNGQQILVAFINR
jgi:hypothetical protein